MAVNLLVSSLLIYCFACYGFLFYWINHPCDENDECDRQYQANLTQNPIQARVAMCLAFLLLSPLIVPFGVFTGIREYLQGRRRLRHLLQTHEEYAFIWQNPTKLPNGPRSYLDEHTDEFLDDGFREVGTYILKTMVPDYYGRLFISQSGTCVASLSDMDGDQFFSFSTLLESGRVLETSPIDPPEDLICFTKNPRMTAQFAIGETIDATYRRHLEKMSEIFSETSDRPLEFDADQACDVLVYEGRVFSRELFNLGRLDAPPPEPVLPEGRPTELECPLSVVSTIADF